MGPGRPEGDACTSRGEVQLVASQDAIVMAPYVLPRSRDAHHTSWPCSQIYLLVCPSCEVVQQLDLVFWRSPRALSTAVALRGHEFGVMMSEPLPCMRSSGRVPTLSSLPSAAVVWFSFVIGVGPAVIKHTHMDPTPKSQSPVTIGLLRINALFG